MLGVVLFVLIVYFSLLAVCFPFRAIHFLALIQKLDLSAHQFFYLIDQFSHDTCLFLLTISCYRLKSLRYCTI